jgi:hypothetical protein
LSHQSHAERFLALDEFPLEKLDQRIAHSGMQVYWRNSKIGQQLDVFISAV